MPIVMQSTYSPPPLFSNPHVQTVFPSVFRTVNGVHYQRERIGTPDDDFVDVDWARIGSSRMALVLHGLEGDSGRAYVRGMVRALNKRGWDAVAMNFRSCSGECNRTLRFYHSGETEDIHTVLMHVLERENYAEAALVGFSLGGNVILKYLGEQGTRLHPVVKKAAVFSVPCDLTSGAMKLSSPSNRLYLKRFLRMLHEKIRMKMQIVPGRITDEGYGDIKTFREYDDRYTAPIHGFASAEDYWAKASSKPGISRISIPALLVNAADDPFLAEPCYPIEEAKASNSFFLEIPAHGGHVGFVTFGRDGEYWSERRAVAFLNGEG
ncbi:MAG: alpha/beta fold hydrolase [Desulfomonile tiedjei]|nr:alpha/beta fold hydrolase [Desulfomonile tiedjei]